MLYNNYGNPVERVQKTANVAAKECFAIITMHLSEYLIRDWWTIYWAILYEMLYMMTTYILTEQTRRKKINDRIVWKDIPTDSQA